MNQEFDYNSIIATAKTNMNKRWNREDWMEDTIQDILEDWLTKNAQELGSEILNFTLREIQQEVNKRHAIDLDEKDDILDAISEIIGVNSKIITLNNFDYTIYY